MGWPWGTGQVQLRSWTWTWTWSCGLGVLLDEVAKRARRSKPKAKRVSLTTMPMQSKVMQQHTNEKKDAMQRNESAAATILTKNEARSKRYYARIEAGARELRRAEKEKAHAERAVVDAGGGRTAQALEAASVIGSDSCAIVSAGGRVCAAGVEVGHVTLAASVDVRGEVMEGAMVACAAGLVGEADAGAEETSAVVCGQKLRYQQLKDKLGTMRPTSTIAGLMPPGTKGLKSKVPKRIDFGAEGAEGDAAHEVMMNEFSVAGFGADHAQDRTLDAVSMHGAWTW